MHTSIRRGVGAFVFVVSVFASVSALFAQSNSGIVSGTVTDPAGALIPGATVSVSNPVSGTVDDAPTFSDSFNVLGTVDPISTSAVTDEKPAPVTMRWYGFNGILVNE